jgi:hypothetical protein
VSERSERNPGITPQRDPEPAKGDRYRTATGRELDKDSILENNPEHSANSIVAYRVSCVLIPLATAVPYRELYLIGARNRRFISSSGTEELGSA